MKQLFDAIRAGELAVVESMLDEHPGLVSAKDDSGLPALTIAFYHHKPDVVTLLESHGARFDLFSASIGGRADKVKEALAASPDAVNSFSADGWTPLHLAAFFGCGDCVQLLLDGGAKVDERSTNAMRNMPLHAAAAGRHLGIVRVLLERGASVNARQHGGWTALHAAAGCGDTALAELLIGAGADLQARADNQQCAMDLAVTKGRQQMVDMLEHYGAAPR